MSEHPNLAAAVCAVMADVQYVQKGGRNDHHRYTYVSDADLLMRLQPSMAKHGLCLMPSNIERSDQPNICHLVVTYTLMHTSGQSATVMVPGSGSATRGSEDKGAYKAMTGAYKYALRQLFAVPTGDDPERPPTPEELKAQREQESEEQAKRRRAAHDREWENGGRAHFCAALSNLEGPGLSYDMVSAYCLANDRPKPSQMSRERRDALLAWLRDKGQTTVLEWSAAQGGA